MEALYWKLGNKRRYHEKAEVVYRVGMEGLELGYLEGKVD